MNWRVLLVVFIAAVATMLALTLAPNRNDTETTTAATQTASSYAATQAELIQTGDDGQPVYRLQAARISQQAPGAPIALAEPQLQYRDQSQGIWALNAQRGTLPADTRRIDLEGDVLVKGTPPDGGAALQVHSERLHVDMDTQLASTDTTVQMEWNRMRLAGKGMKLDLQRRHLELKADVHGQLAR